MAEHPSSRAIFSPLSHLLETCGRRLASSAGPAQAVPDDDRPPLPPLKSGAIRDALQKTAPMCKSMNCNVALTDMDDVAKRLDAFNETRAHLSREFLEEYSDNADRLLHIWRDESQQLGDMLGRHIERLKGIRSQIRATTTPPDLLARIGSTTYSPSFSRSSPMDSGGSCLKHSI
ncbi:hypothetical protein SBA3_2310006 [Candidatus Sulfopaludibacter sp. SbA3]|nr:hypothetical protein SBA3_2310006 [Candidatus Sulfopaludibacter sp. SbA3]